MTKRVKAPRHAAKAHAHKASPNALSPFQEAYINKVVGDAFSGMPPLRINPREDFDAERYLGRVFWSKYASPGAEMYTGKASVSAEDRQKAAIKKWLLTEVRNSKTNNRVIFDSCDFGFGTSGGILKLARRYILETLGAKPPRFLRGSFTGGASTRVKRGAGSIALKFEGKAHVSESAKPYWMSQVFENTGWFTLNPEAWETEIRDSSVLFTVPKNSEIDRVACKEPEVNMLLQRGCGDFIRSRLRRNGIDLNDQTHNQRLARDGSAYGTHATMDLSSASDTISTSIVRLLLPFEWFGLLNDLRVAKVELPDGSFHQMEMFSSMGNGFTFELESLIFWALTRAVSTTIRCRGKILVYGDDIVAPTETVLALGRVLPWFGFIVNVKKTFTSGAFRESCGGHYFNGVDVTPVYFRERLTQMTQVIQLGNQLIKWMSKTYLSVLCSDTIKNLLIRIRKFVPAVLHGGQSYERIDALVTGDSPRRRLVQVHKPAECPQLGGYLWWLYEKAGGSNTSCFSPSESAELGRWVIRPNRSWYERDLMGLITHVVNPELLSFEF